MSSKNNHNIILPKYLAFVKESLCEFFRKKESRRNPARIPPQTPPAGGKTAEARRIHSPRQIVSPCLVRISSFNHLDFARKTFELCPTNTAMTKSDTFFGSIRFWHQPAEREGEKFILGSEADG